jgi:hypothetical protein
MAAINWDLEQVKANATRSGMRTWRYMPEPPDRLEIYKCVAVVVTDENGDADLTQVRGLEDAIEAVKYPVGDERRPADLREAQVMVVWKNHKLVVHRDHDLPAVTWVETRTFPNEDESFAQMAWYQGGYLSRGGRKPTTVGYGGIELWHCGEVCGCEHRLGGLPSGATVINSTMVPHWSIHGGETYTDDPNDDPESGYWAEEEAYRQERGILCGPSTKPVRASTR